jgi:phosphoribosylformylglycinamidine (FGAM) synthase-like amidotransferase family enzyme
MTVGIVVFPGSNCDRDMRWALEGCLGRPTRFLWHEERDLSGLEAVVLPGGFSYGDYLRCGAIARFAPVLEELRHFAERGGPASRCSPRWDSCRVRSPATAACISCANRPNWW